MGWNQALYSNWLSAATLVSQRDSVRARSGRLILKLVVRRYPSQNVLIGRRTRRYRPALNLGGVDTHHTETDDVRLAEVDVADKGQRSSGRLSNRLVLNRVAEDPAIAPRGRIPYKRLALRQIPSGSRRA